MKYIKFLSLLALALLLAGCNLLSDSETVVFENGQKISKVQVDIGGNGRTILPNLWDGFSKFVLSAEPAQGNSKPAPAPVEVVRNEYNWLNFSPEISLPYGDWIISVTAFIEVSGTDYAAAKGSVPITVNRFFHSVAVPVNTPVPGGQGTFAYNITYPSAASVSVKLDTWPIGQSPVYTNNSFGSEELVIVDPIGSGIYFLTITGSGNGKTVTRNEIVHIYQHDTTKAEYNLIFDLSQLITMSGNVTITKNGEKVREVNVTMYRSDNDYWLAGTEAQLDNNGNGTWEIIYPVFDVSTGVYFTVDFEDKYGRWSYNYPTEVSRTLFSSNVSGININVNVSTIYLSGHADILVNGEIADWANIDVYKTSGDEFLASTDVRNDNYSWEVELPPFDVSTGVYFIVRGYGEGEEFNRQFNDSLGSPVTAFKNDVRNIILLQDSIILTGKVTVKVNGSFADDLEFYWNGIDFGFSSGGNHDLGYTHYDTYTGEWAKLIPDSNLSETIYLTLYVGVNGCQLYQDERVVELNSKYIPYIDFTADLMWD